MNGIHTSPRPVRRTVETRPTETSCASVAFGRILRYTSHVSSVEHELNADASELIRAASMPANTSPLSPSGNNRVTSVGNAVSPAWCTSAYNALAMTPGSTKMNTGRIFRNPAPIVPFLASETFLAASTRCTMCWSVHQYQMPRIGAPNTMPVHGKLGWLIGFHIEKKSAGTFAASPDHPPTAARPTTARVRSEEHTSELQ